MVAMISDPNGSSNGNPPAVLTAGGGARLRRAMYLLGLCGALLLTFLVVRNGAGEVARAVRAARWGVAAVVVFHLVPLAADGFSWWILFPKRNRLPLPSLVWMRWIGESVSNLVPVSSVGGEILRAYLAALRGVPGGVAAATVLGDITIGICVQTVFTLTGISLLIIATGRTNLAAPALAGVPLALLAVGGFYAVQRFGVFRLLNMLGKRFANDPTWRVFAQKGEGIDASIRSIYENGRAIAICGLSTAFSWCSVSVEVWIALRAAGIDAPFTHAIILESICQGVRAAMFFIPGGLGVQEGGYVFIGGMLGIPADTALALSLIRRAREIALGVPGLLVWQFGEYRHLWRGNQPLATARGEEA